MNGDAPVPPLEHLVSRALIEVETLARRDPARTALAAMGVGLALQLLPTRYIVAGATAATLTVLRPVLFTLGIVKALEICREKMIRVP